ncbi:MAG: hypothetical protein KIT84_33620 [Labilithrix sp.]|nr:hypothetical protein [Labilithrix sp.]MCW5815987.1 hypothetical protein [Labilithrix sp.]
MRTFAFLLALTALGTACAATTDGDGDGDGDEAATDEAAATTGAVTATVRDRLRVSNPRDENRLWAITEGNLLHGDWLLQIPGKETWGQSALGGPIPCDGWSGCEADFKLATCARDSDCGPVGKCVALEATKKDASAAAAKVCAGHSDKAILDAIYGVMTRTNAYLDVTSLTAPDGRFLATMRNALTVLDKKNTKITVRFLFGDYPGYTPNLGAILADLTRDVRGGKLEVSVASHQRSPTSWNHSKIIVADGREAIVGGMNLWSDHYLDAEPVRDVSTHVRGPAATATQRYVNELWSTPCRNGKIRNRRGGNQCPAAYQPTVATAPMGSTRMITIGRTGAAFDNPSDTALVAMMDAARSKILMSQQDVGSYRVLGGGTMPNDYFDAITRAARRGVDVTIVTSNEGSCGGDCADKSDAYYNGWTPEALWRGLIARADEQWPGSHTQLCKRVHFARLRQSPQATWASGRPLANHAKVVIVDDQAHYVGSQNVYDANLAEFGVIVDDQTATRQLLADYWTKLAQHSTPTAYLDRACR